VLNIFVMLPLGAPLRCAPAFGRVEVMSLIRLPRAYALGYKYVAPAGLGRKPKR